MLSESIVYNRVEDLRLSTLGIGTYLGAADEETDERMAGCLRSALAAGINFIDTAPNYRAERSESVIGDVLSSFTAAGGERREIVLGTKVGFLPRERDFEGETDAAMRRRYLDSGLFRPEWIQRNWQSFHPRYIEWQLAASLVRLRSEYVDIYYLHNPEALLLTHDHGQVERILTQAFEALEPFCRRKQIRYLGVATWNAFLHRVGPETLALADVFRWAIAAGVGEFFRFVQMPINLGMPAALTATTQWYEDKEWSVVRLARHLGLHVIASAPLRQGTLPRVALPSELNSVFPHARSRAQICLEFARAAPGVSAALVGVTNATHLDELLELAAKPTTEETAFTAAFS